MKPYYSSRIWAKIDHPVTEATILVEAEYSIRDDESFIWKKKMAVITSIKTDCGELIDVNTISLENLWRLEDLALMDYNEGGEKSYGKWK